MKTKHEPGHGDSRVIKRFAIFPIHTTDETAWMETVYIYQVYYSYFGWINERFTDADEYYSEE